MIELAGADVVCADRLVPNASILIDGGVIRAVGPRDPASRHGADVIDVSGCVIAPGFIDAHVHGIEGTDVLEDAEAVERVASRLPKFGVTAFCPTSVACPPEQLATFLAAVHRAQMSPQPKAARVVAAHLESNFINPEWNGAQPAACLRTAGAKRAGANGEFSGQDILDLIARHREAIAIVTLAPELPGGIELVRQLVSMGIRVSLGHTGATYEQARAAIDAGARHATHLFNRMSSITSRAPGVVGAVLDAGAVTAEIICDGHHVHPALVALAIRAKSISRVLAITDGTAAAGLPLGSRARLGEQIIIAGERTAVLDDGTLAGSVLTMDGAFRWLVSQGLTLPDAARLCAATPAEALGLTDVGVIAPGCRADLVVMDRDLRVRQTYLGGRPVLEH